MQARWRTPVITDREFLNSLNGQDFHTMKDFLERVGNRTYFLVDPANQDELLKLVVSSCPNAKAMIISAADSVCKHTFDLLGSSPVYLGDKIDWHVDFITGHRFNRHQYYVDIRPAPYPGGYDIKVPWELSRCQHFAWLGQAYWFTNDEKYAQEFVDQVGDWIARNPWPWGVNWTCTMDVSIRVVNWLWGYHFFLQSPRLSERFVVAFYKSLLQHGRHIYRNLENQGDVTGNHYLSNLVGLIYLGNLCPKFNEASAWREFGLRELENEMFKQVYPDGVNFEASTSYHRLTLEMFLSVTILAQRNGHQFGAGYLTRLEKMVEFVMHLTKPDGTSPLIGDNDNGRLHRLKVWNPPEREWVDFRYLLAIGAVIFRRQDFAIAAQDQWEEAIWLLGEEVLAVRQSTQDQQVPYLQLMSQSFPDAGLYVMRHDKCYLAVNVSPNGQNGNGGHAHNDSLSIEYFGHGQTWLIDPGAYVYTADYQERNRFRSTAFHNTVVVDGQEQSTLSVHHNVFQLARPKPPILRRWLTNDKFDLFTGEHSGYTRLRPPIIHRRTIFFDKLRGIWLIHDQMVGDDQYSPTTYFHLAPNLNVTITDHAKNAIIVGNQEHATLTFVALTASNGQPHIESGSYSPGYGSRVQTTRLRWDWGHHNKEFIVALMSAPPLASVSVKHIEDIYHTYHEVMNCVVSP
jgi:hypothetical protein